MEAIRELGEASINVVHLAVNFGKISACQRTVARDLQALEVAGMVSSRRATVWHAGLKRSVFLYSLATPVELQRRLSMIKRLTKRELALLSDGKMPADLTVSELLGTAATNPASE
jgi:DNA-binding transcriptional ArsR family regulator